METFFDLPGPLSDPLSWHTIARSNNSKPPGVLITLFSFICCLFPDTPSVSRSLRKFSLQKFSLRKISEQAFKHQLKVVSNHPTSADLGILPPTLLLHCYNLTPSKHYILNKLFHCLSYYKTLKLLKTELCHS